MARSPGRKRATRKLPPAKPRVQFSEALGERICEALSAGVLLAELARDPQMPARCTIYRWRDRHPEFGENLRIARELQGDALAEDAVLVADAATPPTLAQDKVRITSRLALAARAEREAARADARLERAMARAERLAAAELALAEAGKPKVIYIAIRDFVPVRTPDGRLITREILADGSHIDHE
ncbi:MAG: hypothetical protein JF588_03640 [Caulobacterales bacterium]|nr:hypothetical protein [Caulobacterales bacterium]